MTVIQSKSNETLRRTYLRELGVHTYFPRRMLPGARESSVYVTAMEPGAGIPIPAAPQQQHLLAMGALTGCSAPGDRSQHSPVAPPAPVVAPMAHEPVSVSVTQPKPEPETVPAEDVKFAFAYFPVNDELAVINELPWARTSAVANSTRQLLASILKALGVPCEEKDLSSMVFSWPMPDMPLDEQDAQSARLTLEGFLGRRLKLRPVRHLLVLAEQSAGFLFPAGFSFASEEPLFRHPHFDVSITLTRSLNAMEAVPEIKRGVWQKLQPLKSALAPSQDN